MCARGDRDRGLDVVALAAARPRTPRSPCARTDRCETIRSGSAQLRDADRSAASARCWSGRPDAPDRARRRPRRARGRSAYEPECVPITLRCAALVSVRDHGPRASGVGGAPVDGQRLLAVVCPGVRRAGECARWRALRIACSSRVLSPSAHPAPVARPRGPLAWSPSSACVQSSTPPAPVMSPWPKRESLVPPNENGSRGTGTPTLTPIMPLARALADVRATAPLCVNTLVALPYGLARSIASAAVQRRHAHDAQHRAEQLLARAVAVGRHVIEDRSARASGRRSQPAGGFWLAPVETQLAPSSARRGRSPARAASSAAASMMAPMSWPEPDRATPRSTIASMSVLAVADRDQHAARHAALPGAARERVDDAAAPRAPDRRRARGSWCSWRRRARARACRARRRAHRPRCATARRADEAVCPHVRMSEQRIDRVACRRARRRTRPAG